MSNLKGLMLLVAISLAGCASLPELPATDKVVVVVCHSRGASLWGKPEEVLSPPEGTLVRSMLFVAEFKKKLAVAGIKATLVLGCKGTETVPGDSLGVALVFFAVEDSKRVKVSVLIRDKDPGKKMLYALTAQWLETDENLIRKDADTSAEALLGKMRPPG